MIVGPYRLSVHNHGFFRLDGGAMFGSVPRALWEHLAPPDASHRILLATRSLIVEGNGRKLMIDVGCGDKWADRARQIFAIEDKPYQPVEGVTDVLLTHLHFDHAGGVSRWGEHGQPILNYPGARHYVSQANYENARSPHAREKASYLAENVQVLEQANLVLTQDGDEVWPGLSVHQSHGHTRGLQWAKLSAGGTTVVYPADIMPTSKHLPVPYVMGYDMCAERCMEEKAAFVQQAVEDRWIIVFEHDPELAGARVKLDEKGRPVLAETFDLE